MSINRQQKNIINPYVSEDIEYDFVSSKRNLFVISSIHEYYLSSFNFLPQNKVLNLSVQELQALGIEKNTPNLVVTAQDLRAYSFLYPQNCNLIETEDAVSLELIGDEIANDKLKQLVSKLDEKDQLNQYTTNSSPTAILPENINSTSIQTAHTKLIAILPFHSSEYRKLIYKSIGVEQIPSLDDYQSVEKLSLSVVASSYVNNDENVDIYDWRANCEPGTETNKIYYNSVDDKFYYTERTDLASSQLFDQGYWTQQGRENAGQEMIAAITNGVSEILKYTGRFSQANLSRILSLGIGEPAEEGKINFLSHLDVRPGSRWIYAVRIPRSAVEDVPENNDVFVSYDEFELTPLERARVLLDPEKNKSSIKSVIKAENLVIHLPRVTRTFSIYAKQLDEEGIAPEDLQGIDLDREVGILDGFLDDLALACVYNKVRLDDEDIIEFSFTNAYNMEYFTYNGYLMTRGVGNKDFYPENEEEENNKAQKILNTFSDSTPTTFSAVANSQKIYNDYSIVDEDNLKPWVDFFSDYLFPSIELSAEKIRQKAANSRANARRNRRKNIFTKVSELAKEGKDIEDFYRRINSSRNPYYQIGRAITSLDCDTGQAQALKDVMKIWSLMDSKISIRGKIREAILLLRDEVVKDSVTRAYLTQAIRAEENPQLFIRDIEKQINEQIFCSLDVLGNVIETSFLDPGDMNPTKKSSGATPAAKAPAPVKIQLRVPKGWKGTYDTIFSKDTDLYEQLIIKIVSAYLKSVAVGIGKDVIKAALGCGPNNNRSDTLNDAMRDLKYGILDLNEYVEDLDLIDIAKSVDLVNVSRSDVDGTEQVTKTDPTNNQLMTFISDVSNMCTPRELDQLIFGSADNVLYELILETVTDGVITFPINSDLDPNGNEEIITRTIDPNVYGSFEFTKNKIKDFFIALGDAMRDENIEDIAQLNISPLDAYCSSLEPDLGLERLGFRISPDQLEAQYASIAEDKINKINALCDWLKDLDNILQGLQDLLNDLPIMKQYEELLEFIATISNALWNSLTEWWSDLWGEEIDNDSSVVYNLYLTRFGKDLYYTIRNIISTKIMAAQINRATGEEGFLYTAPSSNRYFPRPARSPVLLPYPAPATIDDNGSWWWAGPLDNIAARPKDYESSYALRTAPQVLRTSLINVRVPNPDENRAQTRRWNAIYSALNTYLKASQKSFEPDQWIDDDQTSNAKTSMSIENPNNGGVQVTRIVKNPDGTKERKVIAQYTPAPGDIEPNQQSVDYHKMVTSIGPSLLGGPITEGPRRQIVMPSRNDEFISRIVDNAMFGYLYSIPFLDIVERNPANVESESLSVSNPTQYIDQQIDFSFANDQGKSRMKQYLRGTNRPLYQPNDENCVTNKEVAIANAIVLSIQARLQRFFMNTVSMASAYPHWNSFGTKKLVVDYLFRKVYDDLDSRGLSNIMFEYSDVLKRVYVDNPDNRLEELNTRTPKEYIKSLVEKVYSSMLDSVSDSVYSSLNTSPYSRSTTRNRYQGLIKTFYERILEGFQTVINDQTYNIYGITGQQQIERAQNFVTNVLLDQDGEPTEEGFYYGAYYFPIGFMIGQYLITYDSLINVVRNFKSGHMRSLVEIANADDAVLSAISEQEVTRYSNQHVGFPYSVVITSRDPFRTRVEKTFYSRSEVQARVLDLSIITGIDSENFNKHLQYFLSNRQRDLPNIEQTFLRGLEGYNDLENAALVDALERGIPSQVDRIYSTRIIIDFISKVLDGSLSPIEQSLISRLNWFSLDDQDIPALQNAYGDFFESKVVEGRSTPISVQGFNIEEIQEDRDDAFYIRGYESVPNVIRRFSAQLRLFYEQIDNRQDYLDEKLELENIFRL